MSNADELAIEEYKTLRNEVETKISRLDTVVSQALYVDFILCSISVLGVVPRISDAPAELDYENRLFILLSCTLFVTAMAFHFNKIRSEIQNIGSYISQLEKHFYRELDLGWETHISRKGRMKSFYQSSRFLLWICMIAAPLLSMVYVHLSSA